MQMNQDITVGDKGTQFISQRVIDHEPVTGLQHSVEFN